VSEPVIWREMTSCNNRQHSVLSFIHFSILFFFRRLFVLPTITIFIIIKCGLNIISYGHLLTHSFIAVVDMIWSDNDNDDNIYGIIITWYNATIISITLMACLCLCTRNRNAP
jgi:hypothetical protein